MAVIVRADDWQDEKQADAAQRLGTAIEEVQAQADAMKTSGAGYKLTLGNYANDAAAAAGGILIGQLYRNGSVVQVRVA